jgi:hypothetical protein
MREIDLLESCIVNNFIKNADIFTCIEDEKYNLYGYKYIDSVYFRTNFRGEHIKLDSVPEKVFKAFKADRHICSPVCRYEMDDKIRSEVRFWLRRDSDSIFTVYTSYYANN